MKCELEVVSGGDVRKLPVAAHQPCVVDEVGIQVVSLDRSIRIEPLDSEGRLRLDGEELVSKELAVGEFVVLDGVRLRCLAAKPESPSVSVSARSPGGRASVVAPANRRSRLEQRSSWLPLSAFAAAILVVGILLVKGFSGTDFARSPAYYLDIAQAQYDNNDPDRALESLATALREATGEVRDRALALEKRIRLVMREQAASLQLSNARQQFGLIESFIARYLQAVERPPARQCVRLCDQWLERHREVCASVASGKGLLVAVEEIRARYITAASLGSPDTAADVIFSARSHLRFQWRAYKEAVATLDAFLRANPDEASVVAEREWLLADGEVWLQKCLRRIDRHIANGDLGAAESDLSKIEEWAVIPAWQALVDERRESLGSKQ
jgi:tetratricopeptide (TPR) repeat protein